MAAWCRMGVLASLVAFYARDIVGNFNPQVYRFANGVIPSALSFLLAPVKGVKDGLADRASSVAARDLGYSRLRSWEWARRGAAMPVGVPRGKLSEPRRVMLREAKQLM